MTAGPTARSTWRAAGWGGLIAAVEMAIILALVLAAKPFGPIPHNYAGAAMFMFMMFGSIASFVTAILIGLALGAVRFRQVGSQGAMWGQVLCALGLFSVLAGTAVWLTFRTQLG